MKKDKSKTGIFKAKHLMILLPCIIVVTIIFSVFGILRAKELKDLEASKNSDASFVDLTSSEATTVVDMKLTKTLPENLKMATLTAGVDFLRNDADYSTVCKEIDGLVEGISKDKFNAINLSLNYKDGLLFNFDGFSFDRDGNLFEYTYKAAKQKNLYVFCSVDFSKEKFDITNNEALSKVSSLLSSDILISNCDGFIFDNLEAFFDANISYNAARERLSSVYKAIYEKNNILPIGFSCSPFFEADSYTERLIKNNFFDFYLLENNNPTNLKTNSFKDAIELWQKNYSDKKFYNLLYPSLIGKNITGFKQHDQLLKQFMMLSDMGINEFAIDSYYAFANDKTGSTAAIRKYLEGKLSNDYTFKYLSLTSPKTEVFTTDTDSVALIGGSDIEFPVFLDGKEIERNEIGYFSLDLSLKDGLNTFVLEHKGTKKTLKITFKRTLIKEITPTNSQTLLGDSSLTVTALALKGSTVTATLSDMSITLKEYPVEDSEFSKYLGKFIMPIDYDKDVTLGKISFKVSCKYGTDTKLGGEITVKKTERPVPPDNEIELGDEYIDVGNKYIAEVVTFQAETFNGDDYGDFSRPTNNYLPKGTVDYCSETTVTYGKEVLRKLRFGKMVYSEHRDSQNIKVYKGTLPDHNEVNLSAIAIDGRHTKIYFDVDWKAPFKFELLDQKYYSQTEIGDNRDYRISEATYSYVDITFCYATEFSGEFELSDNPVFKKAEWIPKGYETVLRLHLRKTGKFYGWSAEYDSNGQLVFSFLNPTKIVKADNSYGYSLKGVTIAIDVGHGGSDAGAVNGKVTESELNLKLALKLKAELESIGATVIMNRNSNVSLTADQRILLLKQKQPDFFIAIHRNGADSAKVSAYNTYHFNAFSSDAAKAVNTAVNDANLYKVTKWTGLKWHNYYPLRGITDCPTILTENGYMSNAAELALMLKDDFNVKCAKAITKGIVNYFVSIQ